MPIITIRGLGACSVPFGLRVEKASDSGLHILPLPKVGQEVGRFLIEKELPRGGQARVYRAWQLDLQRPVALKLLPASFASDNDALTRFRREIENVAKVSHPNVVHVYEAGELDGHAFFTMEFIEGEDAETVVRKGPLGPDEAAALIEAVARGVQQAHRAGIVHRDIKPGNIILRKDDTPVLTDFGLAQDLSHSNALTQTGVSMGTPAYMAPEQARGERARVGKRSDVYALGATLYTLLTGKRPVEGESAYELMVKVAESEGPKWPRDAREEIPLDLRAIVERAMQNDPGKRYESAEELADDLERFLRGDWVVARSRGKLSKLWARGRRFIPAAAVLVLAAGVAAGIVYSDLSTLAINDNGTGKPIDYQDLSKDFRDTPGTQVDRLFGKEGPWTLRNATAARSQGDDLLLTRRDPGHLLIAHRDPVCWGDFELRTQLFAQGVDGPVTLLVGMPESESAQDTAYGVALGDGALSQFVLYRLGVPVFSGQRFDGQPVLESGRWYEAAVTRRAQSLGFALTDQLTGVTVAGFEFEDDFPALVSEVRPEGRLERQRYGISAHAATLGVRNVTVSHSDHRHSTEELLFSVGQYAEAEARLKARLAALVADNTADARSERARLYFLRGRCLLAMGKPDSAAGDLAMARELTDDMRLRAQAFLLGAGIETVRGNDEAALAQLRAARLSSSGPQQARVFHAAATTAKSLEAEPDRALLYHDYVANNALGTPQLVADALHTGAKLRLARGLGDDIEAARAALRRVASPTYARFGATFGPAVVLLFEQRWNDLIADPEESAAGAEVEALAGLMETSSRGYGVDATLFVTPLVRASWRARLAMGPADSGALVRATRWLALAQQGDGAPWANALQVLAREEHPALFEGGLEARKTGWNDLVRGMKPGDPGFGALSALADFFLVDAQNAADAQRRADLFRHSMRRELKDTPRHWIADAEPEKFIEYCVGLYFVAFDRAKGRSLLETAATGKAGALALLKGRVEQWLPQQRE